MEPKRAVRPWFEEKVAPFEGGIGSCGGSGGGVEATDDGIEDVVEEVEIATGIVFGPIPDSRDGASTFFLALILPLFKISLRLKSFSCALRTR